MFQSLAQFDIQSPVIESIKIGKAASYDLLLFLVDSPVIDLAMFNIILNFAISPIYLARLRSICSYHYNLSSYRLSR